MELIVYYLAEQLAKQKHEVSIVAPQGSTPPPDVKLIPTINLATQAYQENSAFEYYKDELTKDYDIIADHSHAKFASQMKAIDFKKYIPTVHTVATPMFPVLKPNLVCLSKAHAKFIHEHFIYDTKYVYNGLDPTIFDVITKKRAKTNRFIFVGRPNPEKGALFAIEYAKRLKVPLDVIAGRLSLEPTDYVLKVAQACTFASPWVYHGVCSHKKKNYMIARAKALLFPLQWEEPFGMTVIEALMSGTPVITFDRGAMAELLGVTPDYSRNWLDWEGQGKVGYLVPVIRDSEGQVVKGDDDKFIEAMKLIDNVDNEECRRWAVENFSSTVMANNYLKLYKEVMEGNNW